MHHAMSPTLVATTGLTFVASLFLSSTAMAQHAPQGEPQPPPPKGSNSAQPIPTFTVGAGGNGDITAGVEVPGGRSGVTGPVEVADEGPSCEYRRARGSDFPNLVPGDPGVAPGSSSSGPLTREVDGVTQEGWFRLCDGGALEFYWSAVVDAVDLVPDAAARARSRLPLPAPDISPPPDAGGIVNLGLWLAIADPGPTSARAGLSGAWAEATGTLTGFTVDFGNGDVITCPGLGVPIAAVQPDLDTADEGPCGYTYRASSPDDQPFQMTVTASYAITWTTSDGRSGTLDTSDRSITFDYDVDEIQTVGERG